MSFSYILPKCVKTREPKDEHCVLQCTYTKDNICDPIPLDNPKNHTALPYITWGLIWDLKNKKDRSQLSNLLPDSHLGFQNKRKESLRLKCSPDKCPEFEEEISAQINHR